MTKETRELLEEIQYIQQLPTDKAYAYVAYYIPPDDLFKASEEVHEELKTYTRIKNMYYKGVSGYGTLMAARNTSGLKDYTCLILDEHDMTDILRIPTD